MTEQDINEAVYRKLGLVKLRAHRKESGSGFDEPAECFCDMPDYCHSIEAAWEILNYADDYFDLIRQINGNWVCYFAKNGGSHADADTAPMAICLAFLKLP